jgi:demethylmenaquinone methyltransferase/2-methoxy-6-polyprenyl-1,4-benzoquinol methylase
MEHMSRAGPNVSPRVRQARSLFSGLGPTYDRVGAALSFGQDPRWRRFMVSRIRVPPGGRVLDVATGTALVARRLADRTGAGLVVGLDQSEPMLRRGIERVAEGTPKGRERVRLVLGDGQHLPFGDDSFDALTFTYLLRYVDDPEATLRELARVVKPGGTMANLEFHVPRNPWWRGLWRFYTRAVLPVAGRAVSRDWYEAGRFLGPSIEDLYRRHPLDRQLEMWRAAGLTDVRACVMSLGGGVVIWGTRA